MSKYDDEFKDIRTGVPPENTNQKASINFVFLFAAVGIIFFLVIILFQDAISSQGKYLVENGYVPQQIIVNGILALLVGSIQAWIFRARIKSRGYIFVGFSLLGGLLAGFVGGTIINSGINGSFVIGLINGSIAGGFSSLAQNRIMGNNRYGMNWFVYSVISWAIIFSIGWVIGWDAVSMVRIASAGGFLVIASGIGLAIFLYNNPKVEFS